MPLLPKLGMGNVTYDEPAVRCVAEKTVRPLNFSNSKLKCRSGEYFTAFLNAYCRKTALFHTFYIDKVCSLFLF